VKLAFDDPDLDAQLVRTIAAAPAGCADLGEAYTTAARISDGDRDAWHDQWRHSAETTRALAEASLAGGHQTSARDGLLRAGEYYRQAFYFLRHDLDDPRLAAAYAAHRDTFRQAIPLLSWACQPVQIPYQATTLAGYLLRPTPDRRPRPTVLAPAGYDSTAEAGYPATGVHALARGYACLVYEGPGQGGVLYQQRLFLRHDYEHVLTAVVDWLSVQPGVDPARIALVGHSFAGYLGLRGATGEPRLAALVLNPAQYDFAARLRAMLGDDLYDWVQAGDPAADAAVDRLVSDPHQRQDLFARAAAHGTATLGGYLRALSRFSARGLADRITCPTLVLDAEDDFASDGQADQLAADLTCPTTRHRLTRADGTAGHSGGLGQQRLAQLIFDWLDTALAGPRRPPAPDTTPTS
jgi:alpha-beta hydrolase superfamily lysophospholipase